MDRVKSGSDEIFLVKILLLENAENRIKEPAR
jgi:hypothetical protein